MNMYNEMQVKICTNESEEEDHKVDSISPETYL